MFLLFERRRLSPRGCPCCLLHSSIDTTVPNPIDSPCCPHPPMGDEPKTAVLYSTLRVYFIGVQQSHNCLMGVFSRKFSNGILLWSFASLRWLLQEREVTGNDTTAATGNDTKAAAQSRFVRSGRLPCSWVVCLLIALSP